MTDSLSVPLDLTSACELLRPINCLNSQPISDRSLVQAAVHRVAAASDYQILGICANTLAEGIQALKTYGAALGYQPQLDLAPIEGAVYIKFNPKSALCYADRYSGDYRGVLISCQSAYESGLNEMFGHLPLDLFTDAADG